jgi:hypothetical protein
MSVPLLTPDLRRVLGELERRLGILERRASRTAPPDSPTTPHTHNGTGDDSVVVADTTFPASASGQESTAVGDSTVASGQYSTAVGGAAQATDEFATALGDAAEATAEQATALGANATAAHVASTAIGYAATTTDTHQIMVGTDDDTVVFPGDVTIVGAVTGGGGGGEDRIPGANDFTTGPVTGFGTTAEFDPFTNNGAAISVMLDGDTKPRVLVRADGQVLLGDGTADPTDAGVYLDSGRIVVYSGSGVTLDGGDVEVPSGDVLCSGGGPVIYSPDNTAYRIVVANGGALSTVPA